MTTKANASVQSVNSVSVARRNSAGGLPENSASASNRKTGVGIVAAKKHTPLAPSVSEPVRRSLTELRRHSLSAVPTKTSTGGSLSDTRESVSVPLVCRSLRTSTGADVSKIKQDVVRKPSVKPALSALAASSSSSSLKKISSTSLDSSSSGSKKTISKKVSSPAARSPLVSTKVSSGLRTGSSWSSLDRSSNLSRRRRTATSESRDFRLVVLPQVDIKAGDEVRLDLRGHRVHSLNASGLNLAPHLEFVYLRDNLLSTLEGVEILNCVKVLDLSFNDFKDPGFEPLENCKNLQQLYLAGNQITSLASLPQLPNLEFLSVAQNKLTSLSMASQPRLQVLAASKNKITKLQGFPYLPVLEHLRLEENPILKIHHLQAASILLVGPTLKKFNDRDITPEEVAFAKRYPPHTGLCIRDGWEFCHPSSAKDSTLHFLWKDHMPPGYLLKEAIVDQPVEEDTCHCHFVFVEDGPQIVDQQLGLKYQWFLGERVPSNFVVIPDATSEVYRPKHEEIGRILKVECTPILGKIEYPAISAISSPVSRASGIPKIVKLEIRGDPEEGNVVRGYAEVAWCGGTPGKGVSSWLRRRWNSNPTVIVGAEDEEYKLTIDDIGLSLIFMYTPVTEEGAMGEPRYKYTDFIKAAPPSVHNVQIIGDAVEGSIVKGVGNYFGGREGPSKFEWQRENMETGHFVLISSGTSECSLTNEDVGQRLVFVYIPINSEGIEGEAVSVTSDRVKQAEDTF